MHDLADCVSAPPLTYPRPAIVGEKSFAAEMYGLVARDTRVLGDTIQYRYCEDESTTGCDQSSHLSETTEDQLCMLTAYSHTRSINQPVSSSSALWLIPTGRGSHVGCEIPSPHLGWRVPIWAAERAQGVETPSARLNFGLQFAI